MTNICSLASENTFWSFLQQYFSSVCCFLMLFKIASQHDSEAAKKNQPHFKLSQFSLLGKYAENKKSDITALK